MPGPPLINATPISHAIVAPATTSLMCLDPICMLSPSSSASAHSTDWNPPERARSRQYLRRESNPPSARAHAEPEPERHDGDHLQPDGPDVPLAGERDF